MSQQAFDLRRFIQVVRRHRLLVAGVALIGVILGCAYSYLNPPQLTSTTLVVFPQSVQSSNAAAAAANGGTDTFTATLQVIATSNQVLATAFPGVRPRTTSLAELKHRLTVDSVTTNIISISAHAKVSGDAQATANAVADSYIKYVDASTSPIGRQSASILQPATSASGMKPLEALIITGFLGGLAGALIGVIVALAISRRDKRLRARDEIANSVGIPVLASFPVARPSDAGGWTRLLQDYKPGAVHAWRLRSALRRVGVSDDGLTNEFDGASSLVVLSLASDPGALALGPQLAVFAASAGIPTALVVGPQQDENAVATLRTACSVPLPSANGAGDHQVRVAVCDADDFARLPEATLTVVVAVVDGETPQIPPTLRTNTTILGVSSGAATAEQLARTAVSASLDGREIVGLLVANPDPGDQTTGQVPRLTRPGRHRMPTRLNGITTEIRR